MVFLQRHIGGQDVEQAVLRPLPDQRGAECCRARVCHRKCEGGELYESLAAGVGQPEQVVLREGDRPDLNSWGCRVSARQGERCRK